MHRQQKPHNRSAASTTHNNTSPPSTKRPSFHRHTSPTSSTTTTLNPHTHTSTTSNAKKGSSTVKPQRPSVHHRKSASAHQLHHTHYQSQQHRTKSHQSLGKLLGAGSGPASLPSKAEDEGLEMATSFLQYCAMCEKQITVPSNSVLYCSESCRRKDSCKPLSASSYTYTMASTTNTNMDQPPSPSMSPSLRSSTASIPIRSYSLNRIPSDLHESRSDLDPTEWKPVIRGYGHGRNGSSTSLASSDAWHYLSQFHSQRDEMVPTTTTTTSSSTPSLNTMLPFRRPTHRSTTSLSTMGGCGVGGVPSLVNTPSTTASSVTSSPPSSSDYIGAYAYTYEYSTTPTPTPTTTGATGAMDRPLPPRHNPSFSTSAGATKGVELVVPHIITPVGQEHDSHDEAFWLKA